MKKIIYSLVIMIAAGSLFTACINQEEPDGLKNIRDAKAEYIRAMAKLREADKALKEAEAKVQTAIAAIKEAEAEKIAAEAKSQQIENDYKKALKEAQLEEEKANIQKALDDLAKQRELDDIKHAKKVAKAEAAYEEALLEIEMRMRDLKLAAKDLSPKEKQMLISSAAAYAAAQKALAEQTLVVMQKEQALKDAEADLKLAESRFEAGGAIFETEVEKDAKLKELKDAKEEIDGERTELENEKNEVERLDLKYKVDDINYYNDWVCQINDIEQQIKNIESNKDRYIHDVADYYAYTVHDAVTASQKHIEDWMTWHPEPAKDATEEEVANFEDALAAFVGTHVDEKTGKPVLNIEYKNLASWLPVKEFKGNQTEEIVAYLKELAEKFYEVNKLGDLGELKEGMLYSYVSFFAGVRYGELKNYVNNFQDRKKDNDEQIVHLTIMKEAAQAAALVYAQANEFVEEVGEVTIDSEKYDDWADLVEAYNKAKDEYIAELEKQIEELGEAWDELDAQQKAVEENEIAFYYKEKLAKAAIALEMAEKVQGKLQEAADQLKSIYKNVYKMVSENYEGVIDFSSLLGLGDMNDLSEILNKANELSRTFQQFMTVLNNLQN